MFLPVNPEQPDRLPDPSEAESGKIGIPPETPLDKDYAEKTNREEQR